MMIAKPEALKEGDVVVAEIPPELVAQQNQAVDYARTAVELSRRAEESAKTGEAAMTLFWAGVRKLNERAETVASRGLVLALRERDGKLVAIEVKKTECQCFLCQLKRLGGTGIGYVQGDLPPTH
jgi:hypothetical protein